MKFAEKLLLLGLCQQQIMRTNEPIIPKNNSQPLTSSLTYLFWRTKNRIRTSSAEIFRIEFLLNLQCHQVFWHHLKSNQISIDRSISVFLAQKSLPSFSVSSHLQPAGFVVAVTMLRAVTREGARDRALKKPNETKKTWRSQIIFSTCRTDNFSKRSSFGWKSSTFRLNTAHRMTGLLQYY